jgi:uncharacterized protein (TIGR02145 family)
MKKIIFACIVGVIAFSSCTQNDAFVVGGKSEALVADIDGNVYHTIKIGSQTWMVENLKVSHFRNGEAILNRDTAMISIYNDTRKKFIPTPIFLDSLSFGIYYNNDSTTYSVMGGGKLYNAHAISDPRNIAPQGWHVATDADWTTLENYLIQNGCNWDGTKEGNKLAKALSSITNCIDTMKTPIQGTPSTDTLSNNKSGLSILPAGAEFDVDGYTGIKYSRLKKEFFRLNGYYWSPDPSKTLSIYRVISYNQASTVKVMTIDKRLAFSVRCVKD